MKCAQNMNRVDRTVRVILGLVLTPLAFVGPENSWFLLGLIPLVTGLVGRCPAYHLIGVDTKTCSGRFCSNKKVDEGPST